MRKLILAAAASIMMAGCSTMGMAPAGMAGDMTPEDRMTYMRMAASSDMYEIQSSQIAQSRARNPQMQSFAQMMIRDHTMTSQKLMAAAQAAGMAAPPPMMLPMHADMVARLQARSGADFDREYARQQLMAHEMALALHSNYAARGDTPALRTVAAGAVPVVRQHLEMVRQWPKM
jgi:putative membrane protein